MTNARKAKRNKESSLRNIIDKRKAQKESAPTSVEELDLKTNDADIVSLDKESTNSILMFFKQELLEGIKQGMDEELRSLDSDTRQRLDASGIVKELYEGIKEGINDELKQYIDKSTSTLSETMKNLVDKLGDTLDSLTGAPSIEPPAPTSPTAPPAEIPNAPTSAKTIAGLSTEEREKVASNYLGREKLQGVAPTTFRGKAKEFATKVAFGALGFEKAGERAIEKQRSEAFTIKTETELDPERFKGMSKRQISKTIAQDEKARDKVRKKLAENEAQVSQLRRAGYSDDDVKKLGYDHTRGDLLQDAVRADKGQRLGKEFDPKTAIGSDIKHPHLPTLTEEAKSEAVKNEPLSLKVEKGTVPSTVPTLTEEDKAEAALVQEKSLKNEDEQIDILKNIRDILNKKGPSDDNSTKVPAEPNSSSLVDKALDAVSDIDVDVGKKKPKTPKLSKGLNLAKNIAKGAGVLAAGASVVGGISDIADGKKIESVGDIVPEGFNKLNPFEWAMNAGRYAGDKVNSGVEAVAGQGLGGWLYDKINGSPTEQLNAATKVPSKTGDRIASKVTDEKLEQQKAPVINVPPPTVINGGGGDQKVIAPLFTENMRNNEPSLNAYIRSRY